jgi:hypothetical protein
VIFWSLVFSILLPRRRTGRVAIAVFLVTCILEILQLWHPPILESVRSTFLGVTLIGNSFSWLDMVHYTIGLVISAWLLRFLSGIESKKLTVKQ